MLASLDPRKHPFRVATAFLLLSLVIVSLPWTWLVLWSEALGTAPVVFHERFNVSYRGVTSNRVEHFYNVFYAEDTSGLNRFASPKPYIPPTGSIFDNTAPGAFCAQGKGPAAFPFTSPVTNISENCLSLRISRPKGTTPLSRLPVVVWIHGGGAALGSAYDQLYEPEGLILQAKKNGQPIIFAAMNYRLGIFGFATNKALRDAREMNVGLKDQRAAFEWIRDNIEAFGGNPARVTAMGQSVGASAIGLHLTSYRGERGVPFQKAVMMSGASGLNFNIKSDLVANNTATVARSLGCAEDDFDSKTTIECLRDVSMEKLMNVSVTVSRQLRPPFGELSFYPSYDGDYIPERPSQLLRSGQFVKNIPIIASWVTDDGAWYAPPTISDDTGVLTSFSTFIVNFSKFSLQRFLALYPVSDFERMVVKGSGLSPYYYRAAQINRDMWFTCPVLDFTWQYARQGSSNVRLYEMNQTKYGPVFDQLGIGFWRVSHLSDIPYMLNGDVAGGGDNSPEQKQVASLLSGNAAAFAYEADPTNSEGDVFHDWPLAYHDSDASALRKEFPDKITIQVVGGPYGSGPAAVSRYASKHGSSRVEALEWERLLERCEFINSITEEIGV